MRFVAPEILKGEKRTDEASDVYSLAMTIYTIATGKWPFHEIHNPWAVSRAAEEGRRPSRFHVPVPPDPGFDTPPDTPPDSPTDLVPDLLPVLEVHASEMAPTILRLGSLPDAESEQLWVWLEEMWDHDPSSRPSVSAIRNAISLVESHPHSAWFIGEPSSSRMLSLVTQTEFPPSCVVGTAAEHPSGPYADDLDNIHPASRESLTPKDSVCTVLVIMFLGYIFGSRSELAGHATGPSPFSCRIRRITRGAVFSR